MQPRKIALAISFNNGMCMALGENGEAIPGLTGDKSKVWPEIMRQATADTKIFHNAIWGKWMIVERVG